MSWKVSLDCTRAEAQAVSEDGDTLFAMHDNPPVLVADEPDPDQPDRWQLHAYFENEPTTQELMLLKRLAPAGEPEVAYLKDEDWVTMSQAGLEPIHAGRFFVHTPRHRDMIPEGAIAFEIDAGLAFGTGQHATTAGCLHALDKLGHEGKRFSNIIDVGTGTGLLAFAALKLWPEARVVASDIDPVAIEVAEENASLNRIPVAEAAGHVLLLTAPGLGHPLIANRKPYDLLIANILAGPLVSLAPGFAAALAKGGTMILSGLLDSQADTVAAAYEAEGLSVVSKGDGEWRVLVLERAT